jgi:hypothetical protein
MVLQFEPKASYLLGLYHWTHTSALLALVYFFG